MVAVPAAPNPYFAALMTDVDLLEVADLLHPPAFFADALCREYPDVSWFPLRGESTEPAREVCRRCAVRPECLAWAMGLAPDLQGIWAGTSHRQRKRAHVAGLDLDDILEAVDTRKPRDASPSTWTTEPCRGCAGNLSRTDLQRGDGWCWACRPSSVALA